MKILLIVPPCPPGMTYPSGVHPRFFPPLGIGYIASVLEKNGYEVTISDLYLKKWSSVYPVLQSKRYDIVGISCFFPSRTGIYSLISLVNRLYPQTKIILGGPYPTVMAERLIMLPSVTAVVVGEGERTVPELINALRQGRSLSGIRGIVFREDNQIIRTQPREYIENLDELPFPAFHLYDLKSYQCFWPGNLNIVAQFIKDRIRGARWAPILTTRSCEFQCQFCAVHITGGDRPRSRSGRNVADEFEFLNREFGYQTIFLQDAAFPIGSRLARELCENLLRRKVRIHWATNARADRATKENLRLMREAGCFYLLFGVESGAPGILNKINKKETLEDIVETIIMAKEIGIDVGIHIIVGYPGENEHTINETIKVIRGLKKYIKTLYVRILAIFPGTELYYRVLSQGKMDEDYFFRPSQSFFIPYTIEHDVKTLYKWKRKIQSSIKPFFFLDKVAEHFKEGTSPGILLNS
ncbi:MAG: radical SAM protein [Candidatus Omnitrophota bacterium]